jgi:hypothetical protein
MRMLVKVGMPHEPFNTLVRKGKADATLRKILEDIQPEAAYFTEINGQRTAILIVDVAEASRIPSIVEPFFLQFNADCKFHPVMLQEDLNKAGLGKLGKKWK